MQSRFWLMISYTSFNASYSSFLFQEKFFQIPASEILTNNFLQQKMQMTMNTLCPPGRKLGQLAVILKAGWEGKGSFNFLLHMQSLRSQYAQAKVSTEKCWSLKAEFVLICSETSFILTLPLRKKRNGSVNSHVACSGVWIQSCLCRH